MQGSVFVIESGTDGSGKATQTNLLYERLKSEGYKVMKVSYPNYNSDSSALVKMYLRGDFGKKADDVDAYIASTFYAADRYASYKSEWEEFYKNGGIIIADRYTTSNMVHQASKMNDIDQRNSFLDWLDKYEYDLYKLPRPKKVFFLDVPVEVSQDLIKDRNNKFTNDSQKDIHESDVDYLKKTYENSKFVADKYQWNIVNCIGQDGQIKSVDKIHQEIYSKVVSDINRLSKEV
nr:thymidylate kinase [uncultured Peptostreptococcus sp.]